jgi:protein-L-isoaspartate O-methyltransferase
MVACEIIPKLAAMCVVNTARWRPTIRAVEGDGSTGLADLYPQGFDRIFLSAVVAGPGFDEALLLARLKEGGILLYPEALGELIKTKKGPGGLERQTWGMVGFVPLKGKNSKKPIHPARSRVAAMAISY